MARTNKTTRKSTPPHIRASRPSKLNLGKVAKATPKAPKIKNFWYKSNMISDITIVYGKHGEKRFKDHRFVLCNSSDWFIGASSHPLFEANERTITLKEDYPEALEALFEYAYTGDYHTTRVGVDWDKKLFMQHARVFIAADKYMAKDLADYAIGRFKSFVEKEGRDCNRALFKYAVEQLYLHDNLFGFDQQCVDENRRFREQSAEEDDEMEDSDSDEDEDEASNNGHSPSDAILIDEQDYFDPKAVDELVDERPSIHPLDRLRAIVVKATVEILAREKADFNHLHLAMLFKHVPEYAAEFALAGMRSGQVIAETWS